jgi:GLPGLI family protein
MMKHTILITVILLLAATANAQYILGGKIEYERKTNAHAQYEEDEWFEKMKATVPKFTTLYYDMVFDTARTFYKPGRQPDDANRWGRGAAPENIVYTDIRAKEVTALKAIFETKFLVQDTLRNLAWKEKNEIRTIAGHPCHKAVSVFCDSVYVVAFYAEDIPVSGGPEMFGGLPGMILELAIPRLHTVWTATKVEMAPVKEDDIKIPQKGKKVNQKGLYESLKDSFSDWGKGAITNVWWSML